MIGDKLLITDYHRQAAAAIFNRIEEELKKAEKPYVISVAGESGSGKSETAKVLAGLCEQAGYRALILQQDDYFTYPPQTNHRKRQEDIGRVGPGEVKLDLLEANIEAIKTGAAKKIVKPLADYDQDSITEETVLIEGIEVVVVEGTYTTALKAADYRTFIDRNYRQTKQSRMKRSRDPLTGFMEKVLSIEHEIISAHKQLADLVVGAPDHELENRT